MVAETASTPTRYIPAAPAIAAHAERRRTLVLLALVVAVVTTTPGDASSSPAGTQPGVSIGLPGVAIGQPGAARGMPGLAEGRAEGQAPGQAPDLGPRSIYDPRTDPGNPAYDPTYNPHQDPSSPLYDENYDPRTDPNHPLKDGTHDPGAAWEGVRRGDGTPSNFGAAATWPWRELFFDSIHPTGVKVYNRCETTQTVSIFVYDLPYLEGLPAKVRVPGKRTIEVPVTIRTPPEPSPPLRLGPPPYPPFGWVPPPFIPRDRKVGFHQPNFIDVKGRVVLWHPWTGRCRPRRETYTVTGHIHFREPADDDPDPQPQRANRAAPCWLWWSTGQKPPELADDPAACRDEIRGFAIAWRDGEVAAEADHSPPEWDWLPSVEEIPAMGADELVGMKVRAEQQMAMRQGGERHER